MNKAWEAGSPRPMPQRPSPAGSALLAALVLLAAGNAQGAERAQAVPARFQAGRVFVRVPLATEGTLELYLDSGGAPLLIGAAAAARARLVMQTDPELSADAGRPTRTATAPALRGDVPALPGKAVIVARLSPAPGIPEEGDGMVGAAWLAGHVWTWDYPRERLQLEGSGWRPAANAKVTPLGFRTDPHGARLFNYPSLAVRIDGESIPMLLDTGAETYLTEPAQSEIGGGPRMRATSMISASVFDRWRGRHPEWRYIPDAQAVTHAAMIEVPRLEVASIVVGPVWFTRRPDDSFHRFMSAMTDRQVEGALGANALGGLRMTIDYLGARAAFVCVSACVLSRSGT